MIIIIIENDVKKTLGRCKTLTTAVLANVIKTKLLNIR